MPFLWTSIAEVRKVISKSSCYLFLAMQKEQLINLRVLVHILTLNRC